MANMSFMLTPSPFVLGTKTVTRRNGWWRIKLGVVHHGILKGQGLKHGEHPIWLGDFIPLTSDPEPLYKLVDDHEYGLEEMILEGFPNLTPEQFCEMFLRTHKGTSMSKPVNRISFKHIMEGRSLNNL